MIPTFTYIAFAISDQPQEWFGDAPSPFPEQAKHGDLFMWKDIRGKYHQPWVAKYYRFNGHEWTENMSDEKTLGELIVELIGINGQMWNAQEDIYKIRRMTQDEFKATFASNPEVIWQYIKDACDLNIVRNNKIKEVDQKIVEVIEATVKKADG